MRSLIFLLIAVAGCNFGNPPPANFTSCTTSAFSQSAPFVALGETSTVQLRAPGRVSCNGAPRTLTTATTVLSDPQGNPVPHTVGAVRFAEVNERPGVVSPFFVADVQFTPTVPGRYLLEGRFDGGLVETVQHVWVATKYDVDPTLRIPLARSCATLTPTDRSDVWMCSGALVRLEQNGSARVSQLQGLTRTRGNGVWALDGITLTRWTLSQGSLHGEVRLDVCPENGGQLVLRSADEAIVVCARARVTVRLEQGLLRVSRSEPIASAPTGELAIIEPWLMSSRGDDICAVRLDSSDAPVCSQSAPGEYVTTHDERGLWSFRRDVLGMRLKAWLPPAPGGLALRTHEVPLGPADSLDLVAAGPIVQLKEPNARVVFRWQGDVALPELWPGPVVEVSETTVRTQRSGEHLLFNK